MNLYLFSITFPLICVVFDGIHHPSATVSRKYTFIIDCIQKTILIIFFFFLSVKSNFQSEIFVAKVIKSGQVMNFKFWDFKNLKHLLVINSVVKILLRIIWETMIASNQFYSFILKICASKHNWFCRWLNRNKNTGLEVIKLSNKTVILGVKLKIEGAKVFDTGVSHTDIWANGVPVSQLLCDN
jgi:hypothetical protein